MRTSISEVAERFISQMKWSDDATDHERTLVIGNVRAFAAFVKANLKLTKKQRMLMVMDGAISVMRSIADEHERSEP